MTYSTHRADSPNKHSLNAALEYRTLVLVIAATLGVAAMPAVALAEDDASSMLPGVEVSATVDVPETTIVDETSDAVDENSIDEDVEDNGQQAVIDDPEVSSVEGADEPAAKTDEAADQDAGDLATNIVDDAASNEAPLASEEQAVVAENQQQESALMGEEATNKWATGYWSVQKINDSYYRFWLSEDGEAYKDGLVNPEWGGTKGKAGYYAWANEDGIIVRGTYSNGTYVWFADNDGRLLNLGWNVTNSFGQGLQRYYIVDEGVHAARIGLDSGTTNGNWAHYTLNEGYVLRGKYNADANTTYVADNDGRLPTTSGWLVTGAYDGGNLQRYYIDGFAARTGTFEVNGNRYLGLAAQGYVLRGYNAENMAYGNNDGHLVYNTWLVTDKFGHGLQRYWIGSKGVAVRNTLLTASQTGWSAYARPEGYVVRGKYASGNKVYFANNDGRLLGDGWHVTSAFGDGLQRYYISSTTHSAVVGFSSEGWSHYTLPQGYVLRGHYQEGDWVYLADNDGRTPTVTKAGWLVSNAFGDGLQRYYIQKNDNGAWAAKVGFSSDGYDHYTVEKSGYVLRNQEIFIDGTGWLFANNDGLLQTSKAAKTQIIERYLGWALQIANDESHGYSQLDRWGPADYDCSSFVITALQMAGLEVGEATYTGNMRSELTKYGWVAIAYNGDPSSIQRGDILLHDQNHTEFYLGDNQRVGAHSDENGGIGYGARAGDQTGTEISVRTGVGTWFTWVLRMKV